MTPTLPAANEPKDPDFDAELATLAKSIVQKAILEATPFGESVDAFKALTAYYALRLKHKAGDDDDSANGGFSFVNGAAFEEQHHGGAVVRSRSRRPT